jgi:hypothetical protein
MIANALIFILSRLMNILAADQNALIDRAVRWDSLEHELKVWFESLPESFGFCGRIEADPNSADLAQANFAEVSYSVPLCSITIQHYHFAQIILLLHQLREDSNSVRDRLRRYRKILEKIAYHSLEICAIALGRPPGYVQIHMLQPLFVAGQCLESSEERKVIVELLRGIETDLGWTTEYRVKELLEEWGWGADSAPI